MSDESKRPAVPIFEGSAASGSGALPEVPQIDEKYIFGVKAPTRVPVSELLKQSPNLNPAGGSGSGAGSATSSAARGPGGLLGRKRNYTPAKWDEFFDDKLEVVGPNDSKFCVYQAGKDHTEEACFVFLHGAGFTGLSFATVCSSLKKTYRCLAMDYRGHGETQCENPEDLSMQALVDDAVHVCKSVLPADIPIIVVGHSMGGALAVRLTASRKLSNIVACVVIDVVEGTAMAALPHMGAIIRKRPQSFMSPQKAIEWSMRSLTTRNVLSARVSMPSQIVKDELKGSYVWKTDLAASAKYWEGWYDGLSAQFLGLPAAKVLILAGTDRLDKPLIIGQMQGKFQMEILTDTGHVIHEDAPEKVAVILDKFATRHKFVEMQKLNAKIGGKPIAK